MSSQKKHIILVDADATSQAKFNTFFSVKEVQVTAFSTGMEAIQYIKQTGEPDLLVIEEEAKPLGALQTLNYLRDQLNYTGHVVIQQGALSAIVDVGIDGIASKPYRCDDIAKIRSLLQLDPIALEENEAVYRLDYLNDLSEGDEVFIRESIGLFMESVTPRLDELLQFYKEQAYKEVSKIAHGMKPSFEMLQNKKATLLSDALAHKVTGEAMLPLILELKEEYKNIQEALKKDFPELYKV